jgi:hypothetical protein
MSHAAFIASYIVSRYFFGFAVEEGQREATFFTVNKHWAPLVFRGRTPSVSVVSSLFLLSRAERSCQ